MSSENITTESTPAEPVLSGTWFVRRGDQEFRAETIEDLLVWVREGRIVSTDLIFHTTLGRWVPAREVPHLSNHFPRPRTNWQKPLLAVVGVLVLLPILGVATCAGVAIVAAAIEAARPTQLRIQITMVSPKFGDTVLKNVSASALDRVDVKFMWSNVAATEYHIEHLDPGEEIHMNLTPEVIESRLVKRIGIETYGIDSWTALTKDEQGRLVETWAKANAAADKTDAFTIGMALAKPPSVSATSRRHTLKVQTIDETPRSVYDGSEREARERMEE